MIRRSGVAATRITAAVLTPVLLIVVVVVGLLMQGPVSLGPFARHLEDVLSELDPRLGVTIADAIITWDNETKKLAVRIVDARLFDRSNAQIAAFEEATVELRGRELLLGRVVPVGVEVLRPQVDLLRDVNGRFYLRTGGTERRWPLEDVLAGLAGDGGADAAPTVSAADNLTISARHARLTFEDRTTGIRADTPDASLVAAQGDNMMTLSFAAILQVQEHKVSVGVGLVRRADIARTGATVRFRGLSVAALPEILKGDALAPLAGVDVPVSGVIDLTVDDTGAFDAAAFDLSLAAGTIDVPSFFPEVLTLDTAGVRGELAGSLQELKLSETVIAFDDGPTIRFAGDVSYIDELFSVSGKGTFGDLRTDDLKVYWPLPLAPKARAWVATNLSGGVIPEAELMIDLRPEDVTAEKPRDEMVQLDFRFEGVSSTYFRSLPKLHSGRGHGQVTGRTFTLDVPAAKVLDLDVTEGRLFVADLLREPPVLDAEFVVSGSTSSSLTVIDHEPLAFARAMGIAPADAQGTASTRTVLRIPLSKDLTVDDVGVSATSTLRDYASSDGFDGLPMSDGNLMLEVDKSGLQADGSLALNGVAAKIRWQRSFAADAPGDQVRLEATLDDIGRKALSIDVDDLFSGPVPTVADLLVAPGGGLSGPVRMDLSAAQVTIDEILWSKPPGQAADLVFDFSTAPGQDTRLTNLLLTSDDFRFDGDIVLDGDEGLRQLTARALAFGETSAELTLERRDGGVYFLDIGGASLDLRPFFEAEDGEADDSEAADAFDVTAHVGSVWLRDGLRLTDARATAVFRQGDWARVQVGGAINGSAGAWLSVWPTDDGRNLEILSEDAGAVVRALGLLDGVQDGKIRLTAKLPPVGQDGPAIGHVRADDFRVTDAPILAQVLTLGSLTGIVDLLQGDGITFGRVDLPFVVDSDRLTVKDARAVGPALGLTANVTIDRATDGIEATGTVVPAYTINSALGRIPFIGQVLVGRAGEGIFAMTYRVGGTIDQPNVTVNPLTALAPGFLRNIVTGLDQPAVPPEQIEILRELERQRDIK